MGQDDSRQKRKREIKEKGSGDSRSKDHGLEGGPKGWQIPRHCKMNEKERPTANEMVGSL